VSDTVHEKTDQAKDKAREVTGQAQDKAKEQLDSRTTGAGEQLQDKADNLHAVGDQMRERGDDTFAQVADRVAEWTEQAASYLRDADANRMLGDVEQYARKQPWAVAAGGVLLGFAASRIVRTGADRRVASSDGTQGRGTSYEPLGDADIDLTRDYASTPGTAYTGTTGYEGNPTGTGYVGTTPVPDLDPLGDPVPVTDPNPSTGYGQDRPFGTPGAAHVDR